MKCKVSLIFVQRLTISVVSILLLILLLRLLLLLLLLDTSIFQFFGFNEQRCQALFGFLGKP